ncbi:hypothetical protein NAEGRDRAFT_68976 [Naegleria gruberi]|uniref:Uncharacterized protein n=1 Tax=Naegleria gruberi TaxID=5762 RepID=D2VJB3_NAEGR|nr:uncharacterized protein NAEGRDRAFT_68976 [Naegleria gruberi]EFC42914.1 hypothetical protein NAEGRDRAFT_68976 [Naegleria gruberi]|eukprot:XP_002675658.1 hypothetical protein NAEGRDRAFT_68976 [Naegleria gruberi strain NEG-M]
METPPTNHTHVVIPPLMVSNATSSHNISASHTSSHQHVMGNNSMIIGGSDEYLNASINSLDNYGYGSLEKMAATLTEPSNIFGMGLIEKKKKTNPLHEVRMREKQMLDNQRKKLSSTIDRNLERKRLSSAYTNSRKQEKDSSVNLGNSISLLKSPREIQLSLNPTTQLKEDQEEETEFDTTFSRKFHYVHIQDEDVTVTKAFSRVSTAAKNQRRISTLSESYFIPSLVELCANEIAKNFEKRPTFEKIPTELRQLISKKLSVNIPLQISVPLIDDDDYWKKCCFMRWSIGQLGTYCTKQGVELFHEENPARVEDIMIKGSFKSRVQQRYKKSKGSKLNPEEEKKEASKTWKQLYLEINFDEFLETLQPQKTILQELKTIFYQPKPEEKTTLKNSELTTLRTLHEIKRKINEEKALKDEVALLMAQTDPQKKKGKKTEETVIDIPDPNLSVIKASDSDEPSNCEIFQKCLHSNQMRPNVNYYLLHCKTLSKEEYEQYPIEKFRDKLTELFDGLQSQGTSRLSKITNDDDIFTFYESAIQKREQKMHMNQDLKMQYWLLNKKEMLEESDADIQQMFEFIRKKNQEHLTELCNMSKGYVKDINIRGIKEHIDIQEIFEILPFLDTVRIEYSARNVGMTFDTSLLGIKKRDCQMLAKILSDSSKAKFLTTLVLSENLIDDEQTKIITSGLYLNTRITSIDLSHNRISVEGCKSIAAMLKANKTLKILHISDNDIQTDGALYIGSSLKFNSSLKELNLSLNKIGDAGALSVITNSKNLQKLNLANNVITEQTGNQLIRKMEEYKESNTYALTLITLNTWMYV